MRWAAEFPGLAKGTYLNSCAHGLLPRSARAAIERHLDQWEAVPDWVAWTEAIEGARRAFARFIGARDDEVAVQANVSSGLAAVLNALPRGRVLTTDLDFPTAPFAAERQRARGLAHDHVRAMPAPLRAREWSAHLRSDTSLATIPAVASFTGYRLDVPAFVEAAHAQGVPVLVDAFQACGTYPIDVRAWDVDFLVTGVYKWLLAPAGLAFLYVRRDHHDLVPTTSGWHGAAEPQAMDPLAPLAPDARRFQYGGPSVVGCVAARETLRLLADVGLSDVERHNRALVDRIIAHARERKWEVVTPEAPEERASIVTFRVPDLPRALEACERAGVVVNPRMGGIRVSPHFYNEAAHVDRLFEVLDAASR